MRNAASFARRRMLAWLAGVMGMPMARGAGHDRRTAPEASSQVQYAPVVPGYVMRFPHDEGSHPDFRIEWWYVTGWLADAAGRSAGFQITFFRARLDQDPANPSAFAPRQLMIAHAALADPAIGRLVHAQRAARTAFDLAGADVGRTRVWLDDWYLGQQGTLYTARIPTTTFQLELTLTAAQSPLLQGVDGYSRKGPEAQSASYYYSLPQLAVRGTLSRDGERHPVSGNAWLDHEWTSRYMDAAASGWDWVCANFDDGSALMAFRMRDREGGTIWTGGSFRRSGATRTFDRHEIEFTPLRTWRSPRSGTVYPVAWAIRAGHLSMTVEPLMDDQEHDARRTTGTIYWEGAVRVHSGSATPALGYLELTGYWRPFRF